ncbi:cardiomyopathy-associated protein 5 [Discoglossus pictus]
MEATTRKMESVCTPECDRASEISLCLEDEVSLESVLNAEEAEELTQSLKEVVDTEDVKPKLQCLMSNPCFSMVTVQCEDSGIHWETSSSRCSTPWASEASTTSDVFSMESSSAGSLPGKVIFIMDDGKIRRKKVRASSDLSRQSSRLKRNADRQKQASKENMEESFKQALEKAKGHSISQTGKTNTNHSSPGKTEGYMAHSLLGPKCILGSSLTENTESVNSSMPNKMPEQVQLPFSNSNMDRSQLISSLKSGQPEMKEKHFQDTTTPLSTVPSTNGTHTTPDNVELNSFSCSANSNLLNKTCSLDDTVNELSKQSAAISSSPINQAEDRPVEPASLQTVNGVSEQAKIKDIQSDLIQSPNPMQQKSNITSSPLTEEENLQAYEECLQKTLSMMYADESPTSSKSSSIFDVIKLITSPHTEVPETCQAERDPVTESIHTESNVQNVIVNELNEIIAQHPPDVGQSKTETSNIYAEKPNLEKEQTSELLQDTENVGIRTDYNKGLSTTRNQVSNTALPCQKDSDESSKSQHNILSKDSNDLGSSDKPNHLSENIANHLSQERRQEGITGHSEEYSPNSVVHLASGISETVAPQIISSVDQDGNNQVQDEKPTPLPKQPHEEYNTGTEKASIDNISEDINQKGVTKLIKDECVVHLASGISETVAPQIIVSVDQDGNNQVQDEKPTPLPKQPHEEYNTGTEKASIDNISEDINQKGVTKLIKDERVEKRDIKNIKQTGPDKSFTDVDYFEKFTLIDDKIPMEPHFEKPIPEHEIAPENKIQADENEKMVEDDSYLLGYVDESFYGVTDDYGTVTSQGQEFNNQESNYGNKVQDSDLKEAGEVLFNPEESVLTKSYYFPASYTMMHPELLEEPPALAFLYTDLYEQAKGAKPKTENESDGESTSSVATFHSRISDDDGTGIYFEKYILKDEIPVNQVKISDNLKISDVKVSHVDQSPDEKVLSYVDGCTFEIPDFKQRQLQEKDLNQKVIESEHRPVSILSDQIKAETLGPQDLTVDKHEKARTEDKIGKLTDATKATPKHPDVHDEQEVETCEKVQIKPVLQKIPSQAISHETVENLSLEDIEETAESLDYVIISQEDLQDETSHEELRFDDRDHDDEEVYEFFRDAEEEIACANDDSGFEMIEHVKSPSELSEISQTEDKKSQIDTYCHTCKIPIIAIDKIFGDHKNHDVTTLENAVNDMTENLEELLEKLKESSLKTEDFVSRVESLFNEVEKNCTEAEKILLEQNEKMIEKVVTQHNAKKESFEEVKKMKMEYLYDQMVSFQQNVDTAKEALERTMKEMDEQDPVVFLGLHEEINNRLLSAMENTLSLEKMPSAFSLFEHYAGSSSRGDQKMLKHVPVPQTPKLKDQEPNSATSTSITVYWTMSKEDVIDCFQIYCMEEPQGNRDDNGLLEEYRVTVKESFCILEDLEPDKCYSVWVMAVNHTGCSLPSDKTAFRTAPSTPVIKAEECTVCWNTSIIRWSTAHPESTESFTLEWCRQYPSEGEGLRSVAGVKDQQLKVTLLPNENYFFYVRAANVFGTSEQSEAALISTKATRFHLLKDTAHPAIDISSDGNVISIAEHSDITGIPLVLGELLPASGQHYWEMTVNECKAFSIGATFQPSQEEQLLAQDSTSWCMQCCCTPTSFSYKFLHNEVLSEVLLTEPLVQVGILLDYKTGRLSFFNVQSGHLLFTFRHKFTEAAHPTFALETPGEFNLHTGIELPQFAKRS